MNIFRSINKYDAYVILILAALSGGEFGGALQLSRAFAILLMPTFFNSIKLVNKEITRGPVLFVKVVICWALMSLVWTGDFSRGLQEIVYFVVHFMLFLELIVFSYLSKLRIKSIAVGWALAVLLTAIIAIWELRTGQHLPYCRFEEDIVLYTGFVRRFVAASFYNFNDYEVFLCYSIPFVLAGIKKSSNIKEASFFFVSLFASAIIALFNASRGAAIAVVIMCLFGLLNTLRNNSKQMKYILIMLLVVFIYVLYDNIGIILLNLSGRADSTSMFESERTAIWISALHCLQNTYFMGTGIAGLDSGMAQVSSDYLATHNMFVELLTEFGVFITVFVLVKMYKLLKISLDNNHPYKRIIVATFLALPFIAIISSKYLLCVDLFAFWGSFYVIANNEEYS